jgi:ABC-type transport system substrate-binding protein
MEGGNKAMDSRLTRRRFVAIAPLSVFGAALLAACGGTPTAPTVAPSAPTTPPQPTAAPVPTTAPAAAAPTAATAPTAAPTAAVAPTTAPAATPAAATSGQANTMVMATGSPWGDYLPFRPVFMWGYESNIPAMLTHQRLIDYGADLKIYPGLAEKWDISPDAAKYTYTLKKDQKFSDGTPVTTKDVEATFKLYLTKAANINPLNLMDYIKGGKDFYDGKSTSLPGVQVKDDSTITFELESGFADWDQTTLTELAILPAHVYGNVNPADLKDQYAEDWLKPEFEIGSGPFKFVQADRDKFFELQRNENYAGPKPKLDRILFKNLGKQDTQLISLQKGELDVWNVPPDYLIQAKKLTNVKLNTIRKIYLRVFHYNYKRPYLTDKRVRQALTYAIDRKSLADQIYNGLAVPYNSFMQLEDWLAPELNPYEYNPDKAKQLLKEANWDPSHDLDLLYYYDDPLHKDFFAVIQQQLAAVGVKSHPDLVTGAAGDKRFADGQWDLYYEGWGTGHPAKYEAWFKNEGSFPWWDNQQVFDLFK